MPSSPTASVRAEKQADGEKNNLWGDGLDQAFDIFDAAIAGWLAKSISGNYSLVATNFVADEARMAMLQFNAAVGLAGNAVITLPSVSKAYFVFNNTPYALSFTTGSGAVALLDAGDKTFIECDGVNVHQPSFGGYRLKDFIAQAVLAATGSLPAVTGNGGKYLFCDGTTWLPRQPSTADLSDYASAVLGNQVALAAVL